MKKYLVAFKGYKKYQIEAPDEKRALEWAEIQLAYWKREHKFSVTLVTSGNAAS